MTTLFNIALDISYELSKIGVRGLYYATIWGYNYLYPSSTNQPDQHLIMDELKTMQSTQQQIIDQNNRLLEENRKLVEINEELRKKIKD